MEKIEFKGKLEAALLDAGGSDILKTLSATKHPKEPLEKFFGERTPWIVEEVYNKVCQELFIESPDLKYIDVDISFGDLCENLYSHYLSTITVDEEPTSDSNIGDIDKKKGIIDVIFGFLKNIFLPTKSAYIVILGTKRAGKSTLWKGLGGIKEVKANTGFGEPVGTFKFKRANGTTVRILDATDIGGEDDKVPMFGRLLKEGCYIYYLVDSNDVSSPSGMKRVRSDILRLSNDIKNKQIRNFGIKFLLTHFYEYRQNNPTTGEDELYNQFYQALYKSKGRGAIGEKLDTDEYESLMMIAELDENKAAKLGIDSINKIKNEIGG